MYTLILFLLLSVGLALIIAGVAKRHRLLVGTGFVFCAGTASFFSVLGLWGEALWFHALGYGARFWTFLGAQAAVAALGATAGALVVWAFNTPARRLLPVVSPVAELLAAAGGAVWGLTAWEPALLYVNRVEAGFAEPILGLDVGFYLFTLPLLEQIGSLLLWTLLVCAGAGFIAIFAHQGRRSSPPDVRQPTLWPVAALSLLFGLVVAGNAVLAVFGLLNSEFGVIYGPGWSDSNVRLPAYASLAVLTLIVAALPSIGPIRTWVGKRVRDRSPMLVTAGSAWIMIAVLWFVLAGILPSGFQSLVVEPNEIIYEKPYIQHNIQFTRKAFGLDKVEERQFPAEEEITRQTFENNRHLISEIRLWDWRALDAVYKQFQEIRLYYEFVDVDMDRYMVDGRYRQVMVSARELLHQNLPEQSQTFVNRRFKYTHGYGLTLAIARTYWTRRCCDRVGSTARFISRIQTGWPARRYSRSTPATCHWRTTSTSRTSLSARSASPARTSRISSTRRRSSPGGPESSR